MNEVYAIIVACGIIMRDETDCIQLQQQGPPINEYQCKDKLFELRLDFEIMRQRYSQFRDYVIVESECRKEPLPHGHKPREEST